MLITKEEDFMKLSYESKTLCLVFWVSLLIFSLSGCSDSENSDQIQLQGYPIDSDVYTTRQRTVVADPPAWDLHAIFPYEVSQYQEYGYGNWHYGPGIDSEKRLDIMADDYTGAAVSHTARLLNFFTLTDIHITDEESPAQLIYSGYKGENSSLYSAVMLYSTQVLDAAIQTINAIHKQKPIDFGISLGDASNNAQYNELRWYIDVMDGEIINPDSGDKDNPVPGPSNDYQDEYKAAGLDKTIPWYQTLGNHDHFWMGSFRLVDYLRDAYTGSDILLLGDIYTDGIDSRIAYMGAIDGRTPYGDIIGTGPVADFLDGAPQVMAPDPDRRSTTKHEWMSEFFTTSSSPVGHGFSNANLTDNFACYSFEPKSDMPIKIIVLDDTQSEDKADPPWLGYLDKARYEWLVNELDQGQTENKLMIIAAHVPLALIGFHGTTDSYITSTNLVAKLNSYPNLLLWIAGHRHRNVVTARKSSDVEHPELGFWEVETSSLKDFPQQFRMFEIVRNSDNTLSTFITDVDPAVKDGSPAAISRSYAVATQQLFDNLIDMPPSGVYNAELVKQLSPAMQAALQDIGAPIRKY